ncbi:MAG: hypothetical protein J0I69_14845 [Altererythrobacter sp.]|nr:hypothetical protein [Altererythrobacter sp.]OJU61238.1 MAG: hypothetical protein BGO08_07280 [Altererythrobacter sp. 66-12]
MKRLAFPLLALTALAACDRGAPDDTQTPAASEAAIESPSAGITTPSPTPVPSTIPAAIQGRWGMVPADCDPARDDAKGLLTIGPTKLEFYESVGTLTSIAEASASRIRASFAFTGEGMEWQRDETLDVQDNGQTLIRREYGEDAAPGPLRYSKCG